MSNLQAISRERHASKRWQRHSSYAFAAAEAVVPLTVAELPKAVMSLPTGFIEQPDGFVPVAVLGLQSGKNLFVAPDGRWVGQYKPAAFRSYPFRLMQTEDGKQVLCIDEDSGLVSDGPVGEAFFTDEQPAQSVLDIMDLLKQIEQSRLATHAACSALQKHSLIRPWPITMKSDAGEQQITGLFQVDEAALNALSGEALLEVREAGALLLAYCQLLSMQHLPQLGQMAEAHAKATAALAAQKKDIDLGFMSKDGTISFAGLR